MRISLAVLFCVCCAVSPAIAQDQIFFDGFECGEVCGWNQAAPSSACYGETNILLPGFVTMTFVDVPAGTFTMGSTKRASEPDESVHQVTLTTNYLIGKFEVTQAQWNAMGYVNPSYFWSPDGSQPVETVNYYEAAAFANAVSVSEGLSECYVLSGCTGNPGGNMQCTYLGVLVTCNGFRLPTEAEWERAARSITQTRFCYGDVLECGDVCEPCPTHDQHMVYCSTNTEYAGSRMANGFGIHDLHGNVWELVQDWYEANLGASHVIDPTGPTSGFDRVIRGGGWAYPAHQARSANRNEYPMSSRGADVGFRLARPVQ